MKHVAAGLFFLLTSCSPPEKPDGNSPSVISININERRQTIEGFGGGMVFHTYPYNHPKKDALYDSIFNVAKVNVLRVCNWYDPQKGIDVAEVPMMLEIQQKWPHVKMILTSWSPPEYLKSNNSLNGANNPTLKKNSDSTYMYQEYAEYWYQSVRYFKSKGVRIDWVSIQNEPDWSPLYEGCLFEGEESPTVASYGKALDAVFTRCNIENSENIKFIGPDVPGVGQDRMTRYVNSPEFNKSHIVAYAHHYYDYSGSDWMQLAAYMFGDKPIYQTEFLVSEGIDWAGRVCSWFTHAQIISQMLTYENVSMYCIFSLGYKPASTHCFFSLDTLGGDWYAERPTYHMFKHFSRSVPRGWQRIAASCTEKSISVAAFSNTLSDSLSLILINNDSSPHTIICDFTAYTGFAHQTTDSLKYVPLAADPTREQMLLPVRSITTIEVHRK